MPLSSWTAIPRAAAVDALDAWEHDRVAPETVAVLTEAWGARHALAPVLLALACAAVPLTRGLSEPDQGLTVGGIGFAAVAAWRLGRPLRATADPAVPLRGALVALAPALAVLAATQVTLGEGARVVLWALETPPDWLAGAVADLPLTPGPRSDSALDHLLAVSWGALGRLVWPVVLVGAFLSTSRWLGALIDAAVASVVLSFTLWLARFVAELIGDLVRAVVAAVLGRVGLGFVGPLLELLDDLADTGFVALVYVWVLAACWLVAVELLPEALRGGRVRFVDQLMRVLRGTPRPR